MWISRKRYDGLNKRVEELERQALRVRKSGDFGVYVDRNGNLEPWDGPCTSLVDVLNAMSHHMGICWKQHYAIPPRVEPVVKEAGQKNHPAKDHDL